MENKNYCVIMSGGAGSRFWPFSKEEYPKQFIDFFGTGRSLLQSTYDRFSKIIPHENIFVVTNDAYKAITQEQLPQLNESQIILEPIRRNTAPAIALATYRIKAIEPEANIVVTPSDHLIMIESQFMDEIEKGLDFVRQYPVLLTLGIKPNRPETGYGYIQVSDETQNGTHKVKTFTEKPNLEIAEVFVKSGEFVWNSGIFLWNVDAIMDAFGKYLPEIYSKFNDGKHLFNTPEEKAFIDKTFPFCPNISIDYGILEQADNVYVNVSDFGWSDLGSWASLHEVAKKDESNNNMLHRKAMYIESYDNIIALKDKDKLVVLQGLEGFIVAESDKVLLICRKEEEQRIKHFVTDAKFQFGEEYV